MNLQIDLILNTSKPVYLYSFTSSYFTWDYVQISVIISNNFNLSGTNFFILSDSVVKNCHSQKTCNYFILQNVRTTYYAVIRFIILFPRWAVKKITIKQFKSAFIPQWKLTLIVSFYIIVTLVYFYFVLSTTLFWHTTLT